MEKENNILFDDYEILTEDGFKSFKGISTNGIKKTLTIHFEDDTKLQCTEDHLIKNDISKWIEAKDYAVNDYVDSVSGKKRICSITYNEEKVSVFDILEVVDTHSFYCNDINVHNCVFLDEFAFVPHHIAEEFFKSIYPTISSGQETKMIIVSTPNGMNHFYRMWVEAEEKRSKFQTLEVDWWETPGRDEKWKEEQIANTSEEQFGQEFACVTGETEVTIRDSETGETKKIQIGELYSILEKT